MGVVAALLKFLKTKMSLGPLAFGFDHGQGAGAELLALGLYLSPSRLHVLGLEEGERGDRALTRLKYFRIRAWPFPI